MESWSPRRIRIRYRPCLRQLPTRHNPSLQNPGLPQIPILTQPHLMIKLDCQPKSDHSEDQNPKPRRHFLQAAMPRLVDSNSSPKFFVSLDALDLPAAAGAP